MKPDEKKKTEDSSQVTESNTQNSQPTTQNPEPITQNSEPDYAKASPGGQASSDQQPVTPNTQHETEGDVQSSTEGTSGELETERAKRLQVMADFENYKKRMEVERATFGAVANMGLIQEMLEIHDDLELALQDSELDLDRAKSSITNAQGKLIAATKSAGIEKIEVKVGDQFDSAKMEAVSSVPNEEMKGKVIAVISSAYKYAGQEGILKAAKVIVGK